MDELIITRQDLEQIAFSAEDAHRIGLQVQSDVINLRSMHDYSFAQTTSLSDDFKHLSELIELMYEILGVAIRDPHGNLREVDDVANDLRALNPKIIMSFQELMQF